MVYHPKPRRRLSSSRLKYIAAGCIFAVFMYRCVYGNPALRFGSKPRGAAGNATLGFQKIVVLSKGSSWRLRGLKAAARYSGIDLDIPVQPPLTDEMIDTFHNMGPPNVPHPRGRGEVENWLSFLDILKYIVAQDLESALVLEDDVDWDVRIKNSMELLSDTVRKFTWTSEEDRSPYGNSWDLLWIGHCAEPTRNDTRRLFYDDPSAPNPEKYIAPHWFPWSKDYIDGLAPGKRSLQRSIHTDCSFAIAFSRRGAIKVLKYAGIGEDTSFDTRLKNGCKNKDLSCLVVTPELMHHYIPPGDFGHISLVASANQQGSRVEEEEFEHIMGTGFGRAVAGYDQNNANVRIYQITYFVGWHLAFIKFLIINHFWPSEGFGIAEGLEEQAHDGITTLSSNSEDYGLHKAVMVSQKTYCLV